MILRATPFLHSSLASDVFTVIARRGAEPRPRDCRPERSSASWTEPCDRRTRTPGASRPGKQDPPPVGAQTERRGA